MNLYFDESSSYINAVEIPQLYPEDPTPKYGTSQLSGLRRIPCASLADCARLLPVHSTEQSIGEGLRDLPPVTGQHSTSTFEMGRSDRTGI